MEVVSLLLCLEFIKISNITVSSQRCFAFNLRLASKCLFHLHGFGSAVAQWSSVGLRSERSGGSKPTATVLCPWARHFTPRKYWLITQEAVAPSRHDWKIVDWDVKPQHKTYMVNRTLLHLQTNSMVAQLQRGVAVETAHKTLRYSV